MSDLGNAFRAELEAMRRDLADAKATRNRKWAEAKQSAKEAGELRAEVERLKAELAKANGEIGRLTSDLEQRLGLARATGEAFGDFARVSHLEHQVWELMQERDTARAELAAARAEQPTPPRDDTDDVLLALALINGQQDTTIHEYTWACDIRRAYLSRCHAEKHGPWAENGGEHG